MLHSCELIFLKHVICFKFRPRAENVLIHEQSDVPPKLSKTLCQGRAAKSFEKGK